MVAVHAYPAQSGITVYFTDITESKKLQEKIAIHEHNLSALIDNTTDIIWSVDKDLKLISANQAYKDALCAIIGRQPDVGDYVMDTKISEDIINEWKENYQKALLGIRFKIFEETISEGDTVYRETYFNPIIDKQNNIIGVGCFSRDISEERRYLEKIQTQNKKLQDIAWIQSHKVRAPVATILGLIELFNPDDGSNWEILKRVKEAAENLDKVINEINQNTIED
ncbi:MAG: PAS domain S-box protein [Taibaiella sp.]|nr:PAS domain S-box protein [Taibaiella sp.]